MLSYRNQIEETKRIYEVQKKRLEELETGVCEKDTQEMRIKELQCMLDHVNNDMKLQTDKLKDVQQELEDTLKKLENEKLEKESLTKKVFLFSVFIS